jgi:hypothetical protein
MPRYFFHTRIGNDLLKDSDGVELLDPDQAWQVARQAIRDVLAEGAEPQLMSATMEVTDAAGELLLEFPFSEALIDDSPPPDPSGGR